MYYHRRAISTQRFENVKILRFGRWVRHKCLSCEKKEPTLSLEYVSKSICEWLSVHLLSGNVKKKMEANKVGYSSYLSHSIASCSFSVSSSFSLITSAFLHFWHLSDLGRSASTSFARESHRMRAGRCESISCNIRSFILILQNRGGDSLSCFFLSGIFPVSLLCSSRLFAQWPKNW